MRKASHFLHGVVLPGIVPFSNQLDIFGVELRATFSATRKANGDILQERIKNTVGPWKAGCVINICVQDIKAITSQLKSRLYQDLLLNPSELVLYRIIHDGDLGLINVWKRSLDILVRTFLETSINPKFMHSLFHELQFS